MKIKDLTGKKFGRLTVVNISSERGNSGKIKWVCECDCGNKHIVTGDSLRSGKSKSCGCLKKDFLEKNKFKKNNNREDAILKVQYSHLVRRNTKFTKESAIDFDLFKKLVKSECYYCGITGSKKIEDRNCESKTKSKISETILFINGIDRLDCHKGYIEDNVVACCKYCNTAKNTMSVEDFMKLVKRIYEHNFES